jgi:hypothetical protein
MSKMLMKNRPVEVDRDASHFLWHLVAELRTDELNRLIVRCQQWQIETLSRHAERPVGKYYAEHCEICEGTNKYHVCSDPWCFGVEKKVCVHPTPHELEQLNSIHQDYISLVGSAQEEMKKKLEKGLFTSKGPDRIHKHKDGVGPN